MGVIISRVFGVKRKLDEAKEWAESGVVVNGERTCQVSYNSKEKI